MRFVFFTDMHFRMNLANSYMLPSGITKWLDTQLVILERIFEFARSKNAMVIYGGDLFNTKDKVEVPLYLNIWSTFKDLEYHNVVFNKGNHDILTKNSSLVDTFSELGIKIVPTYFSLSSLSSSQDEYLRIVSYGADKKEFVLDKDIRKIYKRCILITHEDIAGLIYGANDTRSKSRLEYNYFKDWDLVLNGHIHKYQKLNNIVNVGSPIPNSFGEVGENKFFLYYEDGNYKLISTEAPKFIDIEELTDEIRENIDSYNYYRILADPEDLTDDIYKNYNVSYKLKKRTRKSNNKIYNKTHISQDMESFINKSETDLDKERLLKIGKELTYGCNY